MKVIAILLLAFPIICYADDANMREYSGTSLPEMSRSLGITSEQFINCYDQATTSHVNAYEDQPEGGTPDLLTCLQQFNANLTQMQLDDALAKYRPILPNNGSK